MITQKYKLVHRDDIKQVAVTFVDSPDVVFGGEWGSYDMEGKPYYIIVENIIPPPSKAELTLALNAEYIPLFNKLDQDAIVAKVIADDVEYFEEILADKEALTEEYIMKLGVIKNGN